MGHPASFIYKPNAPWWIGRNHGMDWPLLRTGPRRGEWWCQLGRRDEQVRAAAAKLWRSGGAVALAQTLMLTSRSIDRSLQSVCSDSAPSKSS